MYMHNLHMYNMNFNRAVFLEKPLQVDNKCMFGRGEARWGEAGQGRQTLSYTTQHFVE